MVQRLAVTMGDPAGVGPEIIVAGLCDPDLQISAVPVIFGDFDLLRKMVRYRKDLEVVPTFYEVQDPAEATGWKPGDIIVLNLSRLERVTPGVPKPHHTTSVYRYIETATRFAMQGKVQGIVTAPVSKALMLKAGFDFPGHTELLAHLSGVDQVVMMMVGGALKVSLVTTHVPLANVSGLLTVEGILRTILITDASLKRYFGYPSPRIAVAALNPHAGEEGKIGQEEETVIKPAIHLARAQKVNISGPFSADSLFHFANQGHYDAVVCMYHDQGLIPVKLVDFAHAVNITLGLPFVRTSVDHGVAYNIAGLGSADATSLKAAIDLAEQMIKA